MKVQGPEQDLLDSEKSKSRPSEKHRLVILRFPVLGLPFPINSNSGSPLRRSRLPQKRKHAED